MWRCIDIFSRSYSQVFVQGYEDESTHSKPVHAGYAMNLIIINIFALLISKFQYFCIRILYPD